MSNSLPALTVDSLRSSSLLLTCAGFSHVDWRNAGTDFEFVCGNHGAVRVHPVLAELLSPKVARIRRGDAGAAQYVFRDDSPCVFDAFAALVERLQRGQRLHVDKSNFEGLVRVSCELESEEIFSSMLGMVDLGALDVEEALKMLMTKGVAQCDELVKAVAEKFHELSEESLAAIDLETATALLSHPSLRVRDEDSLYEFVRRRAQDDTAFVCLFEFLYFEYLSEDRIKEFASFAREVVLGHLNAVMWDRICKRLVQSVPLKGNPRQVEPEKKIGEEFVYDASRPLDGIIAHLTRECGGNVHEKGVVGVSSINFHSSGYEPKNVVDLGTNKYFCSKNEPGSWLCYDFKERRVAPTSYSITSVPGGPASAHPKSWVFEASNDGISWEVIDRRDSNMDLNASKVTCNFSINPKADNNFRFIRIRQTGKNHQDNDLFAFASLELFGKLYSP